MCQTKYNTIQLVMFTHLQFDSIHELTNCYGRFKFRIQESSPLLQNILQFLGRSPHRRLKGDCWAYRQPIASMLSTHSLRPLSLTFRRQQCFATQKDVRHLPLSQHIAGSTRAQNKTSHKQRNTYFHQQYQPKNLSSEREEVTAPVKNMFAYPADRAKPIPLSPTSRELSGCHPVIAT